MDDCKMLHETWLRELIDLLGAAKDIADDKGGEAYSKWRKDRQNVGSIASRASKLVLTFPVIVSSDLTVAAAMRISKAVESKCVTLLRILFSSVNISHADNLQDYVSKFHRNLGGGFTLDDFMDDMNSLTESGEIKIISKEQYDAVMNDLRNINFTLESNLNPTSINDYSIQTTMYGQTNITLTKAPVNEEVEVFEEAAPPIDPALDAILTKTFGDKYTNLDDVNKRLFADLVAPELDAFTSQEEKEVMIRNSLGRDIGDKLNYYSKQVLTQKDVYKMNELEPTMMMVTFNSIDDKTNNVIKSTGVIGVKAKLYPVDSMEIVNRISSKYSDSNTLFKLIQAGTREISFLRDLVFAIDKAKMDAINMRKESNNAKMFRVLERRARGRHNKLLTNNDASPITTMVISQNEVEYLRKYCNMDITKPSVAKVIMNNYNLMCLVVVDEAMEVARFLYDDDSGTFETLTFDSLDKEQKDNSYKKIVNLMSKVAR